MHFKRTISIVDCHCAGEVGDVIVGGVLDPPNCSTMYEKLAHFRDHEDHIRQLLLNEPRGRPAMCMNLVLPPCNPKADAGFLIMESEEYPPMSGGNLICTTTVLLDTGMVAMQEPVTELLLDTAAGPVAVTADCANGKCTAVAFHNVPSFVFVLDLPVEVPGLGTVSVDIAWGGMIYAIVDATKIAGGLKIENRNGPKLIEIGERIKQAVQQSDFVPVHPDNPQIRGVSILEFTEPLTGSASTGDLTAVNTVVVSPGRFDRCPCGTGSSARMAVMHARGQLQVGERFQHRSIIGSSFECWIEGTTRVGQYEAVLPVVKGSAWITGFRQVGLDPTDPFPVGFRVGDQWHVADDARISED
ncbi:proline racemase [Aspergillus japonicus CBS 114.51]|uniref:Proline racemase n=1 Tax=Aspergillus japonicus CBS 114.51 TaxID=1448312 RepID=A0A8T8XDM7_ASPJA|nr:proline racemase [Aspergillus japonicus CBS 114.51]RAH86131.1 proline racemase [Aspergillus japonicus CBS 114.51]